MATREEKLAAAKHKLQRFQKSRIPGSYSIHDAISSTLDQTRSRSVSRYSKHDDKQDSVSVTSNMSERDPSQM